MRRGPWPAVKNIIPIICYPAQLLQQRYHHFHIKTTGLSWPQLGICSIKIVTLRYLDIVSVLGKELSDRPICCTAKLLTCCDKIIIVKISNLWSRALLFSTLKYGNYPEVPAETEKFWLVLILNLKFAQNCVHVSLTGVWLAENVFITGQFEWVSFQLRFFLIVFRVLRTFLLAGSSQNIEDRRKTKGSAICLVREGWYWEDNDLGRAPSPASWLFLWESNTFTFVQALPES